MSLELALTLLSLLLLLLTTIFLLLNPFLRSVLLVLFWISVEKLTNARFVRSDGFPRPGARALEDVTDPKWLNRALIKKYQGTKVESCFGETIGMDMGNASTMFKLDIVYADNPHGLPERMIVKLVKNDIKNRIPFTATKMNEMETKFYSSTLCDELREWNVLVARGFGGEYRQHGGNCFVLMEDVTQKPQRATFRTEQVAIDSMDEALNVVGEIAGMHGSLFDSKRFETDLSWIVHQNDPVLCMSAEFFKIGWPVFVKRLGHVLPKEVLETGPLLFPVAQQLHDFMGMAPLTLVHGDCHLENSYYSGNRLGFYDWQLMRKGKGALDLASFLGGSVDPSVLGGGPSNDEGEDILLREYLKCLERKHGQELAYVDEQGVSRIYDFDTLKHDFKMGVAMLFVWNCAAALAVPFDTSAHLDYDVYAERLINTVHRTSAMTYAIWYLSVPGVQEKFHLRGKKITLDSWLETPPIHRVIPADQTTHEGLGISLHRAVHSPQTPTSLFDKFVKRPLKYIMIHRATSSKRGHHGQKVTDIPVEQLEGHHSTTFAEGTEMQDNAFDSYYLSGFSRDGPSVALRWCRRFKELEGEVWLAIKTKSGEVLVWPDHPNSQCPCVERGDDTVEVYLPPRKDKITARMSFTCVVPMQMWTVSFDGYLRSQTTGKFVPVRFDLETEACMPFFAFGTHVSPSLTAKALAVEPFSKNFFAELQATHQEHYEQFCIVRGNLGVNSEWTEVRAKGMRDRAFGAREWGYMQRYVSSYFWAGDMMNGPVFNVTMASLPTITAGKFGFVGTESNKEVSPINAMSGNLAEIAPDGVPAKEWEQAFKADGVHYLCRAFATHDNTVGLNMGPNGMFVNFRFANFDVYSVDPQTCRVSKVSGIGGSEFGYRFEGYNPLRPTKAVASPVFAKHD